MKRRTFLTGCVAAFTLPAFAQNQINQPYLWKSTDVTALTQALAQVEHTSRGRLGVGVLDTLSGQTAGYRDHERFLMLSTFKTLAAAYILARSDRGEEDLKRRIPVAEADILEYAPVTRRHVGPQGMTLAELCEATITTSDNTPANLMHRSYGGPEALTRYLRSIGDTVTRADRYEPEPNQPHPTAAMDTTSPNAMCSTLGMLLFGDRLRPESRERLRTWLTNNTTGDKRLRAGVPSNWLIGEKTGTAPVGANDAGFIQPPGDSAVIVSVYLETAAISGPGRDNIIATVGKLVAGIL